MCDPRWVRAIRRLVPRAVRDEIFEPSLRDARAEYLLRRAHEPGPLDGLRYAGQIVLLMLQSWRLLPGEALDRARASAGAGASDSSTLRERPSMFLHDLRHAVRLLRRDPSLSAAAILTLALGVGANVAMFAVVEA